MTCLRYRREFDLWVREIEHKDWYIELVESLEPDWSTIYKQLHYIFKTNVWEPNKLVLKIPNYGLSTNQFGERRSEKD